MMIIILIMLMIIMMIIIQVSSQLVIRDGSRLTCVTDAGAVVGFLYRICNYVFVLDFVFVFHPYCYFQYLITIDV